VINTFFCSTLTTCSLISYNNNSLHLILMFKINYISIFNEKVIFKKFSKSNFFIIY
jgi:hypothetical protein